MTFSNETTNIVQPHNIDLFNHLSLGCPSSSIDYISHPAYRDYIKSASIWDKLKSLSIFSKFFLLVLIKRIISYERTPAELRRPKSIRSLLTLLGTIIENTLRSFQSKNIELQTEVSQQVYSDLHSNGVSVIKAPLTHISMIEHLSAGDFSALRNKRNKTKNTHDMRKFEDSRHTVLKSTNESLFKSIEDLLVNCGIIAAVSKYLGRAAKIVDISPQINDPTDNFWQHFFPDLPDYKPRTAYFHKDASGGDVKAIIYLSDVTHEQGPFSFIIGSAKKKAGLFKNLIQEINDSSGFSGTCPTARKRFAALPKFLQSKCTFGNDIIPESSLAQELLKSTWEIKGTKGHIVVFDSKGIHRGGMVINGERVVITCTLS